MNQPNLKPKTVTPCLLKAILATALGLTAAGAYASYALAQGVTPDKPLAPVQGKPAAPAKAAPVALIQKVEAGPKWSELTPSQQQSLKPLAANWVSIGEAQKRKWLAISKNYAALPAPERAKLHSRMTEWVALSANQRVEARLNFAETKKLSPSEKTATWQAYQALSPEEKQKLAAKAAPKAAGAAAAVKPVAPQKLAVLPVPKHGAKRSAEIVSNSHSVDHNTLLPLAPVLAEQAPVQKH